MWEKQLALLEKTFPEYHSIYQNETNLWTVVHKMGPRSERQDTVKFVKGVPQVVNQELVEWGQ